MIERRSVLKTLALMGMATPAWMMAGRSAAASALEWSFWKGAYTDSGRIIDGPQGGVSHSEGQGYGMLLALAYDDRASYERFLDWTLQTLQVRDDALLAWRWTPDATPAIADLNNASDGDLLVAWAASRAARRFQDQRSMDVCMALSTALLEKCVAEDPASGRNFLLPGVEGFRRDGGPLLNSSYLIIPAFRELAAATGLAAFEDLAIDGVAILADLARDGVPRDWVQMTVDGPRTVEDFSPNAGYDALRVPLYLIWAGLDDHPALRSWQDVWSRNPGEATPTVVDPLTGLVLETSPDPGYRATPAVVACILGDVQGSAMPRVTLNEPYYPATLSLLTRMAQREMWPRCAPL